MKKFIIVTFCIFFGFLQTAKAEQHINIVTTTSQIGDLVQNIVGDSADVEFLMGTGIDPHLYQPTRSDISKLNQADVIFYNGLNLEGKMEHLLERMAKTKNVFAIAPALGDKILEQDPHIWMDVDNWIIAGQESVKNLSRLYPKNAAIYQRNFNTYKSRLIDLHEYTHAAINSIAPSRKILVTAHDAFGYFGAAYNIEVIGIQGISTESEAGLQAIEQTVSLLTQRKVPAVFVESSVGDHNIKAIIEGAAARGHEVKIGGMLYSDAMGAPGTPEGTYIGMMTHNVNTIAQALDNHDK